MNTAQGCRQLRHVVAAVMAAVAVVVMVAAVGPAGPQGRATTAAAGAIGSQPLSYTAPPRAGRIDLLLRRDADRALLLDGNAEVASADLARTPAILIGGPDRQDAALTVDYSFGPIPVPIDYHPGALGPGTDNSLTIRGGAFAAETHAISGPHCGAITLDGVPIVYSNLTPINDSASSATFTFTAPAGAGTINVNTDGVIGTDQADQINDGGTAKFELINFANKTAVTVNAAGSTVTTLTVNIPALAAGLTTLTVGGGAAGSTFNVQAVPAGMTLNVANAANANVNLSLGGSVQAISSPVNITNSGGLNTIVADDSADATGRTADVYGDHFIGLAPATISFDANSTLTMKGGTGSDAFYVRPGNVSRSFDGGDPLPPTHPGDRLTMYTPGTTNPAVSVTSTPSGLQGQFTFGNAATVAFQHIETISPAPDTAHFNMVATQNWPITQPYILAPTGTPPFTLTVNSGGLAPGMVFDTNTGSFSGTPTTAGNFTANVRVTDADGFFAQGPISLLVNPALQIAPTVLPLAFIAQPYLQDLTVTGGTLPYTTFQATNFNGGTTGFTPASITANAGAGTFTIAGTPTAAGTASFTVTVVDSVGATLTAEYALTVAPAIPLLSAAGLGVLLLLVALAGAFAVGRR